MGVVKGHEGQVASQRITKKYHQTTHLYKKYAKSQVNSIAHFDRCPSTVHHPGKALRHGTVMLQRRGLQHT